MKKLFFTYSAIHHNSTLWVMNGFNYQYLNVNILKLSLSFSLAEELYQKVKRLFGDPHQSTEDLKAEVTCDICPFTFVGLK